MHVVHPKHHVKVAWLDPQGEALVKTTDTCKVVAFAYDLLGCGVEAVIGYGFLHDDQFIVLRQRNVVIRNIPDGPRHFADLCLRCGDEDRICAEQVLTYVAAHPEDPDFSAMGITKEKVK